MKAQAYEDPNFEPNAQFNELFEELKKTGKAILTNDEILLGGKGFRRTGYIAVFRVEDVRIEEGRLKLNIAERLVELK